MTATSSVSQHGRELVLPDDAPRVRVTAGPGSAVQKTWNLRRPCTLIGSRRPAHILLHGRDMSAAHCVIVNTGREVLLKDLHTSAGTLCNTVRIGLTVLSDGDVITLGDTKIQVAIKSPQLDSDDSGCGNTYTDPTTFRDPVSLTFVHTDRTWLIHDAVGEDSLVDGEGVVGKQPLLEPGDSHEYQSYCVLRSPVGFMEGYYTFARKNGEQFRVEVPRFQLNGPLVMPGRGPDLFDDDQGTRTMH